MKKKRLTIENRMLIEQLIKLGYSAGKIADAVSCNISTISREVKRNRITNQSKLLECDKTERFPFVCNACKSKSQCKKRKYYYNYKKANEKYEYLLHHSRMGIDMSIDEIDYWNDYLLDRIKNKNQPILHLFNSIENEFPKSIQTFYSYIHKGYFSNINDEMLPRSYSYKPRKRNEEKVQVRIENSIKKGRTMQDFQKYTEEHPNANIVEMDTVIGKFDDKRCIMTLYFRNSKLMLMFLIKKYKTEEVTKVFKKIYKSLGEEKFKEMFEVILTDNGWEFSKPEEIEVNNVTGEKLINLFYTEPYSSWQKGGIERNHEFIRYIIPKGLTFDNLTNKNVIDMMNNINNVKRKSMNYESPYQVFCKTYGEIITKKLHLQLIKPKDVDLSYKILKK